MVMVPKPSLVAMSETLLAPSSRQAKERGIDDRDGLQGDLPVDAIGLCLVVRQLWRFPARYSWRLQNLRVRLIIAGRSRGDDGLERTCGYSARWRLIRGYFGPQKVRCRPETRLLVSWVASLFGS